MADQLQDIVGRMVAAGESEENIAAVIQQLSSGDTVPPMTPVASHGPQPPERFGYSKKLVEDMAQGGAMLPGASIVGKTAVGLGGKLARRIYSGLLKPKQAVKDSFGGAQEIAGTLLEQRAPITRGGLAKVTRRLGESRNTAMDMVKAAEQQGAPGVQPKDIVSEFGDVVKELRKRADIGQPNEMARVGQRGRALTTTANRGANPGDIPLTRAQALKETAQDASSGAYRALERGGQKQLSADDLLDTATARGLRSGIERRVPGVGPQNAKTQTLIGGRNALEDALERESNTLGVGGAKDFLATVAGGGAYAAGAGPAAIPLAIGTRLMTTPSTGSMGAILLNEASKSGILDAATRSAMIAMMRGQQE
jgi:hypothetical protein